MLKYTFIGLLMAMSFISFLDDSIEVNKETIIDHLTEVDGPFVTGKVTDKYGLPIREALVNLYQEEGLIGSVQTDNDGSY